MVDYVVGYMREQLSDRVLMVRKSKPAWQAGLLNGIGGKVERLEIPVEAMVREFKEETGIDTVVTDWRLVLSLHDKRDFYTCNADGSHGMVYWFATERRFMPKFPAKNDRGEELLTVHVSEVSQRNDVVATSRWCIPLAFLDPTCPALWGGSARVVTRGGRGESAGPNAASASIGCSRNLGPGAGAAGQESEPLSPPKEDEVPDPAGTTECRDWSAAQWKAYFRGFCEKHGLPRDFCEKQTSEPLPPPRPVFDRLNHYHWSNRIIPGEMTHNNGDVVLDPFKPFEVVYRYFGSSVFCNRNKCQAGTTCEACRELKASTLPPMQEQRQ